ncbi:DUF4097 family beta strand repeat-containing protein [Microbacterium sp. XT11]|uniref:DUF4097 family beta strand repeat-containing protein n=1 Tax=Microbacterium sp. XT11 TaxID=367477 RepID=UPI000835D004|nr:DUF4097 family beta strand repeat-containing protein [Microbacterium sp. XT11]
MSTYQHPMTPPPAPVPQPVAPAASGPQPPRPGRATWITVTTAVIGGLSLAVAGTTAAFAASGDLSRGESVQRIDATGAEGVDLDASASEVRVVFGDVDEAELSVRGDGAGAWTLDRHDDEIVVRSPDTVFGWWFGRWFDDERSVVLTLPRELEGIDGSFVLNAGSLDVSGEYGELDLEVAAGGLVVDGSATSLDADVSAGRADVTLDGVQEAELTVSAGDLRVELTGTAPRETSIEASAGSAEITLPDDGYVITQEVSGGTLDNRLGQSAGARNSIDVTLTAGEVALRPGS